MSILVVLTAAGLVAWLLPAGAMGQNVPDLAVGSEVRVKAPTRIDARVTGKLLAFDERSITIERDGLAPLVVPKTAIDKLEIRRRRSSAVQAGVIGFVAGAAIFAGIGAAGCEDGWRGVCALVLAPLGAVSGLSAAHL